MINSDQESAILSTAASFYMVRALPFPACSWAPVLSLPSEPPSDSWQRFTVAAAGWSSKARPPHKLFVRLCIGFLSVITPPGPVIPPREGPC